MEIFSALEQILTISHMSYLVLGVVVGLVIGIIPGLGGIAGMSLLLPFLYGMEPSVGLGMLMGLVAVIPTGDTFTSILMGIPGSSASQATVMDGFPMAKKGMAARALSAAFLSSLLGGLIGATILSVFILIARPLVLSFSSAELFMLSLLGLSVVASLSGANIFKGLAACGLGSLVGTIGDAPATGEFRLVFGIDYLYDGIPLVIIGLGIFALPEILELISRNKSISEKPAKLGMGWGAGLKDALKNLPLIGKCSVFGSLIGAIPGLAGSVVDWMTYSIALKSSKDSSQFGKGDIRGVIAPESANNACSCGSMIPTLLFGIPGSGTAAVFLGGMLLLGLQPGISMIEKDLDLTYIIVWSLALANILGALFCLGLANPVAALTKIPFAKLFPILIVVILFAAYQATFSLGDLITLLILASIGLLFKTANWSRPAFLIGFVLAGSTENYFFQTIQFYGYDWIFRPGVIIIGSIIFLSLAGPLIKKLIQRHKTSSEPKVRIPLTMLDLGITILITAFAVMTYFLIANTSPLTKAFPLVVIIITIGSTFGLAITSRYIGIKNLDKFSLHKEALFLLTILLLILLQYYLGFIIISVLFTFVFLYFYTHSSVKGSLITTISLLSILLLGQHYLYLTYPEGLIDLLIFGE